MSWMRQPTNGDGAYTNGDGKGYLRGFDPEQSSRDTSADERSRSRGPGAYGGYGRADPNARVAGPAQLDRRAANRRSRDLGTGWDSSRSRSRPPGARYGEGSRQVEDVLRSINQQWAFMSSDSCIPVKVALQLMDPSSLGLADQHEQFQQTHQQLQNALKTIVNEHHQGFNSSIGTFHQIQAGIHASQQRVRMLKQSLVEAKGNLGVTRPELKAFATTSQNYDQMLQVLGIIEQLQKVPEKLEAQLSEKKFLSAVDTLQHALKLIRKPEMADIGAISDLRVYLSNQEHSVTDILIEELHSHLYLKSPYCENRWRQYTSEKGDAKTNGFDIDGRHLYRFLDSLDPSQPFVEDTTRNPEADTFSYIQLLLEALNRMVRLEVAVDAIEQRLPVELFRVVEKSYTDVEQRHPTVLRTSRNRGAKFQMTDESDHDRKMVLEDMLSTLYAKFEAIAEGHRVVYDVISGIQRREGWLRDSALLRSFNEMWKLYQSEIRSLLHDHLATNGNLDNRARHQNDPNANLFKNHVRDKNKRLFKLIDTDNKSPELATEREDLEFILKASVPGLVSSNAQTTTKASENNRDPDRSATGHKLLVEPSVFNMGVLLPPSLAFLTRLKDVVPPNSDVLPSTLTSFLDDFLINVFYPQLEETLSDLSSAASAELDAFQEDPNWQARAQKPIFKGTAQFRELLEAFCKMLDNLPHDQAFSQLVISQMRRYYDRCYSYFTSLSMKPQLDANTEQEAKRSAALAQNKEITDLIERLSEAGEAPKTETIDRETTALLSATKSHPLHPADLITDRKSITHISTLYTSIRWLNAHIIRLRHLSDRATDSFNPSSKPLTRRWTTLNPTNAPPHAYLPLNTATAVDFDALTSSFSDLAKLIQTTLHLELRLQLLNGIGRALGTTYLLDQPYNDPDPAILALNNAILLFDEDVSAKLPAAAYAHIVGPSTSLSTLASRALVAFSNMVPAMDAHGAARMELNILVLQQNLKNLDSAASLEDAARYWELFERGSEGVVQAVQRGEIQKEEGRELLRLWGTSEGKEGQGQRGLEEAMRALE